jgi:hypothetical protein
MKRFISLAVTVLALAAVPAALADDGGNGGASAPASPAPAGQQAAGKRVELLRLRLQLVERRFARHCGSSSAAAPQACVDFATKAEARLTKLDGNIKARIAKIQQACGATSTADEKCTNADKRVTLLQAVDTHVQALAQKVQAWLDGKTVSPSDPGSDSALDQAAAGLGQLAQQAGAGK